MSRPLRLLLIDDDTVDRMAVIRLLRQTRLEVIVEECSDTGVALAALDAEPFDCVLLDYNLPGSDGITTLADLRTRGLTLPVIALTGQGDEEVAVALMKAGAADYLNKNALSPERLERSLRYALALHRSEEERRQLLERETRAREQAQAANRAKDEFLATLSHELRTPLNAILGWVRLLASGHLDVENTRRAIEIIDRNTRLQAQLIEDLLDISRIITGKLRLDLQPVTLGSVVDTAVESVRHSAEARRITIDTDLTAADATILCDPARMQQVVWNLLSNAIKFSQEDGHVTVSAHREESTVTLAVTDTGIGIDPEFLPFVFDRFRQQDGASTRLHGGLGLGLSIVQHLVELHGGTVAARSEGQGCGSTFLVNVPLAPLGAEQLEVIQTDSRGALASLPSLDARRLLVVDNDADAPR